MRIQIVAGCCRIAKFETQCKWCLGFFYTVLIYKNICVLFRHQGSFIHNHDPLFFYFDHDDTDIPEQANRKHENEALMYGALGATMAK